MPARHAARTADFPRDPRGGAGARAPAVDRPRRIASQLLNDVEASARALDTGVRERLVAALRTLSEHLLEHLDAEERTVGSGPAQLGVPAKVMSRRWPARSG